MHRPEVVSDKHLAFLDAIRESVIINMMEAIPYLTTEFSISRTDAKEILKYWMKTFGKPRN